MADGWIGRAREALVASADRGGWGYRRGSPPAVEPTALAALGLLATAPDLGATARRAADTLDRLRLPDGSLAVSATLGGPGWATPYALLLWKALGSHGVARRRAADWLLAEPVDAKARAVADPEGLAGHDPSIPGWPWVGGTHAWVEPTALAILALSGEGLGDRPRVADGLRLLRDRAIDSGGWNYGNNVVYGRTLRPQPGPTGLALLAMAAARGRPGLGPIDRAAAYLRDELPGLRAAGSLGWGLLGLRAWGIDPEGAAAWLAESAESVLPRDDSAPRLGLLLLASSSRSLDLLGLQPPESPPR